MREIPRIKRVPVPRVKFPKACELDVKCRGVCVLRVKYQNFSCTKDQPPYAAPTAASTSDVTPSKTHYFRCFLISSIIHSICVGVTRCKPTQIVMRGERVMLSSGNFGCNTCTWDCPVYCGKKDIRHTWGCPV